MKHIKQMFYWKSALSVIVLAVGALGVIEPPAHATPEVTKDSFELAQILVPGRVNTPPSRHRIPQKKIPTPAPRNFRPQKKIPTPAPRNFRPQNNLPFPTPLNLTPRTHIPLPRSNRSRDYYRSGASRGSYQRHRRYNDYGYYDDHDYRHYQDHQDHPRGRSSVIITNPATSSKEYRIIRH